MHKTIGQLLLASWIPFILAMSFDGQDFGESMYTVTGMMWLVFGTWASVLLIGSKQK